MPLHASSLLLPACMLMAIYAALAIVAPTDLDYWWHLATGRWIAQHGVPALDPFSYTAGSRPWIDHEWLTQWLMQALEQRFGYRGPVAMFALIQAGTGAVLIALLRQRSIGTALSILGLLLFMLLAAPTWGVRPQIVTALLLGIELWLLERYRRAPLRAGPLILMPVLLLLWSNMHGSFVAGVGVIVLYAFGDLAERRFSGGRDARATRNLLLCALLSAIATLINPYGIQLWLLPLDYVSASGSDVLQYIDEWRSPDFHGAHAWLIPALLSPLLLAGIRKVDSMSVADRAPLRSIDMTDALIVFAFLALALRARYHLPLYGMAVLPISLAVAARVLGNDRPSNSTGLGPREVQVHRLLAPVLVLVILSAATRLPASQWQATPSVDGKLPYPQAAAIKLAQLPADIHLFNDLGWGGFLIERIAPRQKVFIDGRLDLYRGKLFDDYARISDALPGWKLGLQHYGIDTILIRAGTSLDGALASSDGWTAFHRDELAVLYRATRTPD